MVKDYTAILQTIYEQTGLTCAVYSAAGERLCGVGLESDAPVSLPDGATDPYADESENRTLIRLRKPQEGPCLLAVEGCDAAARNVAVLIKTLLDGMTVSTRAPMTKAEKFCRYLSGELDDRAAAALKADYLGKPCDYYVLTLVTDSAAKRIELSGFLEAIAEREDIVVPCADTAVAYFKKCGTEDEYQSANDFAYTLYDNIKEELRINIVVNVGGTAHGFDDLAVLFRQCEFAYSFGKRLSPDSAIYSYKEYIMIKMLSDIPKSTLLQYLDTLLDKNSIDILADEELMSTAEAFLKNSLNISETSRSMYMHRNTLIYRLDKIENATGLNIRHFNDALIFKLITVLHQLTGDRI